MFTGIVEELGTVEGLERQSDAVRLTVRAGLVDEVVVYLAPILLGAGLSAVGDLGITAIDHALHLPVTDVTVLEALNAGDDVNVRLTMSRAAAEGTR
jgi:diaminohydroxyphosphoribosylaminopyrimidine deaminase/5-amino-6-(5-phosphoribosylamino)uracil reductase